MNYNYNNNMYQVYNRASTPNPGPRSNFQPPPNTGNRKPPIKITINNPKSNQVIINTNNDKRNFDHNGPQIELPNPSTPVISFPRKNPDRPITPNQPQISITNTNSGNIQMGPSSLGKINPSSSNLTFSKPNPVAPPITPSPAPFSSPQPEPFHRLSLLSFVSTFEDEKSFNETDLEVLGLDLKCQEPLLPMLHSVLSDAPLLDHSRHPMPECYSKIQCGKPSDKLSLFTPQTLLFIFYTYPRDPLQTQAATELQRRQWKYDQDTDKWNDQDGNPWSVDQWEIEDNQTNELGDSMFLHRTE